MYLNLIWETYLGRFFIPLFLSFNATNIDKFSANRKKLAGNNKMSKLKDKFSANEKKLTHDNSKNANNKSSTDIKILVGEKNINQNSNSCV